MKQFITIIALSLLTFGAKAQVIPFYGTDGNAAITTSTSDTITNAGTTYLQTKANAFNSIALGGGVVLQLNITNVSGTTAGTAILQSSLDGSNWDRHFNSNGTTGLGTN